MPGSIPNKSELDVNMGGMRDLLWLPMENVAAFYITEGVNDITAIILTGVGAWNMVQFIRETAKLVIEDAVGPNGPYEKVKLSFNVARHYDSRVPNLREMREREFCVIAVDQNGTGRVFGTINLHGEKSGMRFFKESTTGDKQFDRNEYECYFYMEVDEPALPAFYDTPLIVDVPVGGGGSLPVPDPGS